MSIKPIKTIVAVILTSVLLSACQPQSIDEQLIEVENSIAQKEYDQAIIKLKNLIKNAPEDSLLRKIIADVYLSLGQMEDAEFSYNKALSLGADINTFAADFFLTSYMVLDAAEFEERVEELKPTLSEQNIALAEATVAVLSVRNRDVEKSRVLMASATQRTADNPSERIEILNTLVNEYVVNRSKPIEELQPAAVKFKDDWFVLSLIAEIQHSLKDFENAASNYTILLEQKPLFHRLNLNIAQAYLEARNFEDAKTHINKLLKLFPKQPFANQQKALVLLYEDDYLNANKHIEIALSNGLRNQPSFYIAGFTNFKLENYEQAISNLEKVIGNVSPEHPAMQMYVAANLRVGEVDDAMALYDSQPSLVNSNAKLAALASMKMLQQGDREQASKILRNIDTDQITDASELQQIGVFKLIAGDESGNELIESVTQQILDQEAEGNTAQAKLLVAAQALNEGGPENARAKIKEWMQADPEVVENYLLAAELEKFLENYDGLDNIYNQLLEIAPNNIDARNHVAARQYDSGEYATALDEFKQNLEINPNSIMAIRGAYAASNLLGTEEQAMQDIASILTSNDSVDDLSLAYLAYLSQDYDSVIERINSGKFSSLEEPPSQMLLANSYMATNQLEQASGVLTNLVERGFATPEVIKTVGKVQRLLGNTQAAEAAMKTLELLGDVGDDYLLLKSEMQFDKGQYQQTLETLSQLSNDSENSQAVRILAGKAHLELGQSQQAVDQFSAAYRVSENELTVFHLFQAMTANEQAEEAIEILTAYRNKSANDLRANMMFASKIAKINPEQAIQAYQDIINENPDNWQAMNNLAWMLFEKGDLDLAYTWITEAEKLAPTNMAVIDTKVQIEAALAGN